VLRGSIAELLMVWWAGEAVTDGLRCRRRATARDRGAAIAPGRMVASSDRVAQGGYPPWAPTDPYGHALVHTVPQITGSLRETLDDTRVGERETF